MIIVYKNGMEKEQNQKSEGLIWRGVFVLFLIL